MTFSPGGLVKIYDIVYHEIYDMERPRNRMTRRNTAIVLGISQQLHKQGLTYKEIMSEIESRNLVPPSHGFLSKHLGKRRDSGQEDQGAA